MTDQSSEPEIFQANTKQISGAWRIAFVFFAIFIVFGLASYSYIQIREYVFHLPPTSPYLVDALSAVIAIIVGVGVYFSIKSAAPSAGDKVSVYPDRLEIQNHGNVRSVAFEDITTATAITNQYGIIFLQIEIGAEIVKVVGITDLKGLFSSLSRRLPPSKVKQESFSQSINVTIRR
jgi:hypothetical protein